MLICPATPVSASVVVDAVHTCALTLSCLLSLGRVVCNPHKPEATSLVHVFPIGNLPGVVKTEEQHDGHSLHVKADVRWMLEDEEVECCTMHVWRDDVILVKLPAVEHSLLHSKDDFDSNDQATETVLNAMDDARHHFEDNRNNRLCSHLLIEFPPGATLSAKLINLEAGDEEELDCEIVKVETTGSTFNFTIVEHWLHFTVARTDTRVMKRGKVEKKSKKSKGASKLANLMSSQCIPCVCVVVDAVHNDH